MRERFRHQNNEIPNLESQATVSSASNDARLSQGCANEPVPDHHSQPLASTQDYHRGSALSPELGAQPIEIEAHEQVWDLEVVESTDEFAALENFDPAGLMDSQDSTISELALETRLQAFQAILDKARGRAGGEIGLISTTDNHSKLEQELG